MYHCTLFIEDTAILKGEIETDNNLKGPLSPDSLLTNVQRKIPNQYFNPPNSQFTETTQRKRDDGLKKETCRYSVGNESSLAQMPDSFAPLQRHRLWFDQFPRGAQRIALPPSKLLSPVSLSLSLSLSLCLVAASASITDELGRFSTEEEEEEENSEKQETEEIERKIKKQIEGMSMRVVGRGERREERGVRRGSLGYTWQRGPRILMVSRSRGDVTRCVGVRGHRERERERRDRAGKNGQRDRDG